jgi:3-(3-hydroxy-phenyl)propionate hydroxylase
VHSATQDKDQVVLIVGTAHELLGIRCPWVIAADGAHSPLRESLGISLVGEQYPERFLVVSVGNEFNEHMDGLEYVNYVADPDEWLVLLRTPDHWRVLFPVPDSDGSDAEILAPDAITARLDKVVDLGGQWDVLATSLYIVSRLVAETMRCGRVLLAGDAAHQNSPLGGMGMNSGIQDAVSAGRRLASVFAGGPESVLDEYAQIRHDVATGLVQADSHANWLVLREPDDVRRAEMQRELREAAADPEKHAARMRRSAMLDAVRSGL